MTEHFNADDGVSRRNLFLGLGAAAGAGAAFAAFPGSLDASALLPQVPPRPQVLGPVNAGYSYIQLDAFAFFTDVDFGAEGRIYEPLTGVGSLNTPRYINAALQLPIGSVIRQINVAYQGQPVIEILRRPMNTPNPPQQLAQNTLAAGGGPKTQTFDLSAASGVLSPVLIEHGNTYALRFLLSAGSSIYGVTIGYQAPLQGFVPFVGADPRVLDTRVSGGKLQPGEERIVDMRFAGARAAVFNLAVTETDGTTENPGGFVAAFRADVTWPGNASINWAGAGLNLSNGVISAVSSPAGAIKIRGGANATHVVIDLIGHFL